MIEVLPVPWSPRKTTLCLDKGAVVGSVSEEEAADGAADGAGNGAADEDDEDD